MHKHILLQILFACLLISPAWASAGSGGQYCLLPGQYERGELLFSGDSPPRGTSAGSLSLEISPSNGEEAGRELLMAIEEAANEAGGQADEEAAPIEKAPENAAGQAEEESAGSEKAPEEDAGEHDEYDEYEENQELLTIADPLSGWNRAMFHFNDKLYFWVLKPVTQGYKAVVAEDFRVAFNNFHNNLYSPVRLVNNLLQLKLKEAGNELIRFVMNTALGCFGMADPAKEAFGIEAHEEDFGQTLGSYGVGHGFYIVWPFLGPSSARDTVGFIGDLFLYPLTYARNEISIEEALLIYAHEKVNALSFRIGDYEAFKKAAIDPYLSMRDAYLQNRDKKVKD